jgi:DNA polymerase III alpha subunit
MIGLRQLNLAISEANMTGFYRYARVDLDILSRLDPRHFLCTTACVGGIMKDEKAEYLACQLHEIFRDNFRLEIQHHPQAIQVETNQKILSLYKKHRWPLIYGTDSHYINHEDALLRKELLLSSGINNAYEDEFDLYLPTGEEAYQLLRKQGVFTPAQIEEAMENT